MKKSQLKQRFKPDKYIMFYKHQVGHLIWPFYIFKILGKLCSLDVIMTANSLNVNPVNVMDVFSIYVQKLWKGGNYWRHKNGEARQIFQNLIRG